MLVGMVAGGWLIIRSILVWGVDNDDYEFGADIPIAAIVLVTWAVAAVVLLLPPKDVLASPLSDFRSQHLLLWPNGRNYLSWNLFATPIAGLLGIFTPFALATGVGLNPNVPPNWWIGLPLSLGLCSFAVVLIWIVLRSAFYGVELTPTHLIARGMFRTRKYTRESVTHVDAAPPRGLKSLLIEVVLRLSSECSIRLQFVDGGTAAAPASSSSMADAFSAAKTVRAWRAS